MLGGVTVMSRCFLMLALGMPMCGCASQQSTLMRASGQLVVTPAADSALVVFVMGTDPRDDGWPFRVVDDKARFLGECVPSSQFAVRLSPGEHALFAWKPSGEVPREYFAFYNQVGAVRAIFEAGKTYVVAISYSTPMTFRAARLPFVSLRLVDPSDREAAEALRTALPLSADTVAGQAVLDRERASVEQHLALGLSKLGK